MHSVTKSPKTTKAKSPSYSHPNYPVPISEASQTMIWQPCAQIILNVQVYLE